MAAIPSRFDRRSDVAPAADETVSQLKLVMFDSTVVETPPNGRQRACRKPGPGFRRLEPTPELLAELRAASQRLETATPEEIIAWGVEHYAPYLTMATAFGPEGCVILAMLAKIAPETYVFNLETGYQFQETLDLRDRIAEKYGIEVDLLQPELSVAEYEALHGGPLYRTNPEPVLLRSQDQNAAAGVGSDARLDERHPPRPERRPGPGGDRRLGQEIRPGENQPAGELDQEGRLEADHRRRHSVQSAARQGYPSIGCWPCTRAVAAGETDERAGRWSGMQKTECGLHSVSEQDGSGI